MLINTRIFDINDDNDDALASPIAKLYEPAIKIENLNVSTKKDDGIILRNINFEAKFGEITAIMGPSGCGKSTLLNYIANIKSKSLKYEGTKVVVGKFKLVTQEIYLHSFFTLEEYLKNYFGILYGIIKNPNEISQRKQDINKVISLMNLNKSKTTKVGDNFKHGLSGGEKRRLSIALELLSNPAILVIDEPTSGLDSFSAEKLMVSLRDLVYSNKVCVVLSIHQPSSRVFELLDKIILIKKGNIYFNGPKAEVIRFYRAQGEKEWENYNQADQALELLAREDVIPIIQKSRFSVDRVRNDQVRESRGSIIRGIGLAITKESNNFEKFLFLSKRNLMSIALNPATLGIRVLMYLVFSLLLGTVFYDLESLSNHESVISRISLIQAVLCYYVLMSLAALPPFIIDKSIFENEVRNKLYHPFLYQYSKWLTSLIDVTCITIITSIIILPMTSLNGPGTFGVVLFVTLLLAEGVATLVSIIVPNYIIGMAAVASLYGVFMLCQGFSILRDDLPIFLIWGYYVSFYTYSFRVFMQNEFFSINNISGSLFSHGTQVLASFDMVDVDIGQEILFLIIYIIAVQILTSIFIMKKYKS